MKRTLFLFFCFFQFFFLLGDSVASEEQKKISEFLDNAFNAYVDEDYEKAMINFQRALQIDPKDKTALRGLKQSTQQLKKLRNYNSKEEDKNLKKAKKLIHREEWIDGIEQLHDILARIPSHLEALKLQGEIGNLLKKRMLLNPIGSEEHLIFQGLIHYLNKEFDQAVKAWNDALRMAPENVKIMIYIERGEKSFRESRRYEVVILGRERARAAFNTGDYQESLNRWKEILEFDPKDQEAEEGLAKVQELLNKKNMESLIGEHYDKGLSLFLNGQYKESLDKWEAILSIDPKNEVALDYVKKIVAKGYKRSPQSSASSGLSGSSTQNAVISVPPAPPKPAPVEATKPELKPKTGGKTQPASPTVSPTPKSILKDESAAHPEAESQMQSKSTPSVNYDKGISLYNEQEYVEAIKFFEGQIQKMPSDLQAKEWLDKIQKGQKEKADDHYNKGLVAYSQGDGKEALKEWKLALKIFPDHSASLRALSKVEGQ